MGLFDFVDSDKKYKRGEEVRVRYSGQEGHIVDIDGNLYLVALTNESGNEFIESYAEEDLERI